jgi:hypothetical protein
MSRGTGRAVLGLRDPTGGVCAGGGRDTGCVCSFLPVATAAVQLPTCGHSSCAASYLWPQQLCSFLPVPTAASYLWPQQLCSFLPVATAAGPPCQHHSWMFGVGTSAQLEAEVDEWLAFPVSPRATKGSHCPALPTRCYGRACLHIVLCALCTHCPVTLPGDTAW